MAVETESVGVCGVRKPWQRQNMYCIIKRQVGAQEETISRNLSGRRVVSQELSRGNEKPCLENKQNQVNKK